MKNQNKRTLESSTVVTDGNAEIGMRSAEYRTPEHQNNRTSEHQKFRGQKLSTSQLLWIFIPQSALPSCEKNGELIVERREEKVVILLN